MREKVNLHRAVSLSAICLITILVSGILCYLYDFYIDEWLCIFFVDVILLMLLIFELEHERKEKRLSFNRRTTFSKVVFGYLACGIIVVFISFLPVYFKPVIVFPLIMYAVGNDMLALITGIYWDIILSMALGGDYYELIGYCLLTIIGAVISKEIRNQRLKKWIYLLLFSVNFMIPGMFYYWAYKEMKNTLYFYGILNGVLTVLAAYVCGTYIRPEIEREVENRLVDILTEDFQQVKELKEYSKKEYQHADKVSSICYRYAKHLGLDTKLCAAAGFYYRLGKWQGEPHVQKGIERAEELYFPENLIQIISEYYGEEHTITTPESALVQIVDAVVMKLEYIKEDVGDSQWNNEIVIIQIINEYSAAGLYDSCGLSMNHFLKIREFLVKEEMLQ